MISTEQAFDMLPVVVDIYDKLDLDAYRKKMTEKYSGKPVNQTDIGIEVFRHILKNAPKIKEEVFGIVAIADGRSVEEIKKQSFAATLVTFKTIFSDKELLIFFKSAMQ